MLVFILLFAVWRGKIKDGRKSHNPFMKLSVCDIQPVRDLMSASRFAPIL